MRIYLDNNATTPLHPAVLEALQQAFRDVYGNASSVHQEGRAARQALEQARESVAALIGAVSREVVFTSGGTESNNTAIHGAALSAAASGRPCHIVTTTIEHPSALEPARQLASRGIEATFVGCGAGGRVDAAEVIAAIRPETRLVSVMLANNETGVIQPVAEVGRYCRERGIHMHCDAVQGGGKIPVDVAELSADSLSLSAHKMHGPKGAGALWVRGGTVLQPHLSGGAQERRRRAGTESVPLAVGFGVAAALAREVDAPAIARLRDSFERRVLAEHQGSFVNGATSERVPNTASICFPGVDAEALVIALDLAGVAVSSGSACSSGRTEPSHVLIAMGLSVDHAKSSIRISINRFTTSEELDRGATLLSELVSRHRRHERAEAH